MDAVLDVQLLGSVFVTLFVIMDPPGTVPIFLALTATMTGRQRVKAARQAVAVAFSVIIAFALFGRALLGYLHISLPALQGAGGLLLLLVALELLTGKDEAPGSAEGVNVALVPLGTPLLAGPGAIVATMVFVQQAGHAGHRLPAYLAIGLGVLLVHVCLWLAMRFAGGIHRILGEGGTTLVTRIAGLLLSAIAVQLVADAVRAFVEQS